MAYGTRVLFASPVMNPRFPAAADAAGATVGMAVAGAESNGQESRVGREPETRDPSLHDGVDSSASPSSLMAHDHDLTEIPSAQIVDANRAPSTTVRAIAVPCSSRCSCWVLVIIGNKK